MTNRERLISLIGFAPQENSINGALLDFGVNPTLSYVITDINTIKKAAIQIMQVLITTADTSNSVVGFSIRYDRQALLKLIDQYKADVGIGISDRIITGIHPW